MKLFLNFILAIALLGCKVPAKDNLPAESALKDSSAPFDFYKSDSEMTKDAIRKIEEDSEANNMVGFHFGIAGTEPPTVEVFRKLLQEKNYNAVRNKLYSPLPAEQYFATIVCERLFKMHILNLTVKEADQIAIIRQSEETLSVCSGCTVFSGVTLKALFGEEYSYLKLETEQWLGEIMK